MRVTVEWIRSVIPQQLVRFVVFCSCCWNDQKNVLYIQTCQLVWAATGQNSGLTETPAGQVSPRCLMVQQKVYSTLKPTADSNGSEKHPG